MFTLRQTLLCFVFIVLTRNQGSYIDILILILSSLSLSLSFLICLFETLEYKLAGRVLFHIKW